MCNFRAFRVVSALTIAAITPPSIAACPGGGNCNGHGTCVFGTTCACFTGYGGTDCGQCAMDYYNYPTCTYCQPATTCNGRGACNTSGGCNCTPPYTGANCQCTSPPFTAGCGGCLYGYYGTTCTPCPGGAADPCNANAGGGSCSMGIAGNGTCACNPGFNGSYCQFSNAGTCSGHGVVDFFGNCNCDAGWTGTHCEIPAVPSITQWRSMRTHAGDGELGIVLNATTIGNGLSGPTVETRQGGIQKILVDFNRPVTLANTAGVTVVGANTAGTSNYMPAVSMVDADTMQLVFAAGFLPDQTCYTITIASSTFSEGLTGDNDVKVRALVGDVTMSGQVTLSDAILLAVRAAAVITASASPASDVNLSGGAIAMADALAAKAQVASPPRAVSCP